jgi:hypothetical protein
MNGQRVRLPTIFFCETQFAPFESATNDGHWIEYDNGITPYSNKAKVGEPYTKMSQSAARAPLANDVRLEQGRFASLPIDFRNWARLVHGLKFITSRWIPLVEAYKASQVQE